MTTDISPQTVLDACRVRGVTLTVVVVEGVERIKPSRPLPTDIAEGIREHRLAIIERLKGRKTSCFDCGGSLRLPMLVCESCWMQRYERDGEDALRVLSAAMDSKEFALEAEA